MPLNLLVYANLVHTRGVERFVGEVTAAGASSLLVPDVLLEEAGELHAACRREGLGIVQLIGPRSTHERIRAADAAADAFLYLTAVQGVTGSTADPGALAERALANARRAARLPLCLGFGLRTRAHVQSAFANGASIAVFGSVLAEAIATALVSGRDVVHAVGSAVADLIDNNEVPPIHP